MRCYLSSFRLGNRPDALLRLLGGRTRAAVVANADDGKTGAERAASYEREARDLARIGLDPAEVDLRRYFGRPERLAERLAEFDLLWVRGGNAFVLRRAFRQSGADAIIPDMLAADAIVYGGYSAGVSMLTPSLRGAELVDDPHVVPEGYDPAVIWDCLGIVRYDVVAHYKSDHPESAAVERTVEYLIDNHVLFVALRDGEAIVRDGESEAVVS